MGTSNFRRLAAGAGAACLLAAPAGATAIAERAEGLVGQVGQPADWPPIARSGGLGEPAEGLSALATQFDLLPSQLFIAALELPADRPGLAWEAFLVGALLLAVAGLWRARTLLASARRAR